MLPQMECHGEPNWHANASELLPSSLQWICPCHSTTGVPCPAHVQSTNMLPDNVVCRIFVCFLNRSGVMFVNRAHESMCAKESGELVQQCLAYLRWHTAFDKMWCLPVSPSQAISASFSLSPKPNSTTRVFCMCVLKQ